MNRLDKTLLITVLLLGGILWLQHRWTIRLTEERDRFRMNSTALLSDVKRMRTDSATMALDAKALRLTIDEYEEFRAEDAETIRRLGVKIRNLEAAARHEVEVKAPIDGQVGNLEAQIGQSIAAGEHIGQIITADLKVQALIDEHYVERVVQELPADFTRDGENYKLEVTKVYPEVKEGQFRTDFRFTMGRPENIRAGQTYHVNLQLGDPVKAVLIPRGGFFQTTGGRWVYVVDESGKFAVRHPIRIGRQNPQYYEVTEGLKPGDRVIVSGYELFGNNEKLILK